MTILQELKEIKSGKKDLRKFGITMAIALVVFGLFLWWRKVEIYEYLFYASPFFLVFGLVMPIVLYPLQKLWMGIAVVIRYFMSRVMLTILFFLIITPIGFLTRFLGKDFMNRKFRDGKSSYWILKPEKPFNLRDYENQF